MLYEVITSLLNNFFNSDFFLEPKHVFASRGNEPLINIKETNDAYHIELAAPGYNKTDFEVELDKNILTILVEKEEEAVITSYSIHYTKLYEPS